MTSNVCRPNEIRRAARSTGNSSMGILFPKALWDCLILVYKYFRARNFILPLRFKFKGIVLIYPDIFLKFLSIIYRKKISSSGSIPAL
jgi:hypothetical protein